MHRAALVLSATLVGLCCGVLCTMAWCGEPLRMGARFVGPKFCIALGGPCVAFVTLTYRRRSAQNWKVLFSKLTLLGVSLILILSLGEWGTRIYLRRNQGSWSLGLLQRYKEGDRKLKGRASHPLAHIVRLSTNRRLGYELVPGLDQDFGRRHLTTNSRGMRDSREYDVEKPAGTLRLVGIGDSGMFGWGLDQDLDYLALLEQNLRASRPETRIEVLNFGVPGFNTQQEVEMLRDRGLEYAPDIVIVGWNDTDFQLPFFMLEQRAYDGWSRSYLYAVMFFRDDPIFKPSVMKVSEVDHEKIDPDLLQYKGSEGVRKAMLELKALSARHEFKILVMGPMRSKTAAMFAELGLEVSNLRDDLPPTEKNKADKVYFMHPRAGGHTTIALHLEKLLTDKGWL